MLLFRRVLWRNRRFWMGGLSVLLLGSWMAAEWFLFQGDPLSVPRVKVAVGAFSMICLLSGWSSARRQDDRRRARFL